MSEEETTHIETTDPIEGTENTNETSEIIVKFDEAILEEIELQKQRIAELEKERDNAKKEALITAISNKGIDAESLKDYSIAQLEAINLVVAKNSNYQFVDEESAEPQKTKIIGFRDPVTNEWIDEI